ncbi:putative carboxylesterase 18 [Penicillium odoratum]|uniref:putative carboxylesterase 18 n=1 Tax=Penicillium odoratum TaxID=1167516 RepID=UPI00254918F1|nr:putative carboxylesterase 18 [Penicillium odoratum]KAJ5765931.1 putative carboxylesterase 18 [Penicillium odoratum]
MNPPTGKSIRDFCSVADLLCEPVDIDCSGGVPPGTLHLIDLELPSNTGILLYVHGGGYCNPISAKGHISFALECAHAAGVSALAFLEYTLSPELSYPGQLVQVVEALRFILRSHQPSQIVLGGDSAGGNLVLALIAHLIQPSPYVQAVAGFGRTSGRFRAVFLISPWVACQYNSRSFRKNATKDYISTEGMKRFTALWQPKVHEIWATPIAGSAKFWCHAPVDDLLITAGEWECFLDDIRGMADRLGAKPFGSGSPVELAIAKAEVHVQCVVDAAVNVSHGFMARIILRWLASH